MSTFLNLAILVTLFLASQAFHKYDDDDDDYSPPPPPPTLPPYSSDRLLDLVRARGGPVDLIFLVPKGYSSLAELDAAKEMATKVLTLYTQNNPFGPTGLNFGLIVYSYYAKVVLRLSQGTSSNAATSGLDRPQYEIETKPDDLYKALHAAYQQFYSEGRPDAKKVLVVFISTQTTGNIQSILDKLRALGVDIFVVAVGDVSAETVLQVASSVNHVIFFDSFTRSGGLVRLLLSTFIPTYVPTYPTYYKTKYTKPHYTTKKFYKVY